MKNFRKTKIICTIGPSVNSVEKIKKLMKNGMDCARVNFSHGDLQSKGETIGYIKEARRELNLPIPILMDTRGPEIRIGKFKEGKVELKNGAQFILDYNYPVEEGNKEIVHVTYELLYKEVVPHTVLLLDDGKIELKVVKIQNRQIITKVYAGGILSNRKSINIPSININMPYLSERDKLDIAFAVKEGVDYIAASFVRRASDVIELREYLKSLDAEKVLIVSKIENLEGVQNIKEIIKVTDGVMVARGDLGVEIAFEDIPRIQKKIIEKCILSGTFVIIATQMLESMVSSPRPTRAEVSDVANAVYDGASAVMLSGETAAGNYPNQAVRAMARIALSAERSKLARKFSRELNIKKSVIDTTSLAACNAAEYINAKVIAVVTRTGSTASYFAGLRPDCPVLALTVDERARRQLNLRYGVVPVKKEMQNSLEELGYSAVKASVDIGLAKVDDVIVVVTGSNLDIGHPSDTVRIIKLTEEHVKETHQNRN